jgi:hypothetical protein
MIYQVKTQSRDFFRPRAAISHRLINLLLNVTYIRVIIFFKGNKYFISLLLQLHVSSLFSHIVIALLTVPVHCHLTNAIFSPASSVVDRGFGRGPLCTRPSHLVGFL